jgi:hypothetical protein
LKANPRINTEKSKLIAFVCVIILWLMGVSIFVEDRKFIIFFNGFGVTDIFDELPLFIS